MRFRSLILSTALAYSSLGFANPLRVDGRIFRDAEGQQVVLRGINVSGASKVPPFKVIRGEDFAPLPAWGFNSLRLLFNWEAFETQKGIYDEAYLSHYLDLVRAAAKYQLYVIVDIHQDAFSRFTAGGCGDGFPEWAIAESIPKDVPKNDESCKNWGVTTVLNLNMHRAWHEFYLNTGGVRDSYLEMVRSLARAVANEPNVLGLALVNEPWGDEKTQLFELYKDAAPLVRAEFPSSLLFLSGAAKTSTGIIGSELPRIPGDGIIHETHFYDPGLGFGKWSRWLLELANLSWKKMADEWQAPVFVGEFGAPAALIDGPEYVRNVYEVLDREVYSGAYWVYTPTFNEVTKDGWNHENFSINNENGDLRGMYQPRPWVEKISSQLTTIKWDPTDLSLSVHFEAREGGNLQIFVPQGYVLSDIESNVTATSCLAVNNYRSNCNYVKSSLFGRGKVKFFFQRTET